MTTPEDIEWITSWRTPTDGEKLQEDEVAVKRVPLLDIEAADGTQIEPEPTDTAILTPGERPHAAPTGMSPAASERLRDQGIIGRPTPL